MRPKQPPALIRGEYKVVYHLEIKDLEYVEEGRPDSPFEALQLHVATNTDTPLMTALEFHEEWTGLVMRTAIEAMHTEDNFTDAHFYLGHWTNPGPNTHPIWGAKVVVPRWDMDAHGLGVTFNGYCCTVSAQEIDWGRNYNNTEPTHVILGQ